MGKRNDINFKELELKKEPRVLYNCPNCVHYKVCGLKDEVREDAKQVEELVKTFKSTGFKLVFDCDDYKLAKNGRVNMENWKLDKVFRG